MNQQLLGDSWYNLLKDEMEKDYFKKLREELKREYMASKCFPQPQDVFKVFQLCPLEKIRIVILSQDPYGSAGSDRISHAHGVAFSSMSKETPYSLQMILREVDRDIVRTKDYKEFKEAFPTNDLTPWVKQGVFLLNTCLTVRAGEPMSHSGLSWNEFTRKVLEMIWLGTDAVFVLLGKQAQDSLLPIVTRYPDCEHYVIQGGHPASGAHGKDRFSGCAFPSKINRYFELKGLPGIDWRLNV